MKKALILFGAGASVEYGAPSTNQVASHIQTALSSNKRPHAPDAKIAYEEIERRLGGYLSSAPNFEQIYHVANELLALYPPLPRSVDEYRPILQPFVSSQLIDSQQTLLVLLETMTASIFEQFTRACASNTRPLDPLAEFYGDMRSDHVCRSYTTNYDDFVLQAVPDLYTGFVGGGADPASFDLDGFWTKRDLSSIFHVHGSVHMGFPVQGGDIGELFWYSDREEARRNAIFSGASGRSRKMSGTSYLPTAVVTGLDKLSLLQQRPMSHYYAAMGADAMTADVIFVIGSGLTDLHLNAWLREARSRATRIPLLYVDYWPDGFEATDFEPDAKTIEMFHGLEIHVSETLRANRVGDWLISQDGTAAIWDKGFQSFLAAPDQLQDALRAIGHSRD